MDYTITIYKKQGEPLYAIWIGTLDAEPQPGTVWQVVQRFVVRTGALPDALCGQLLMSEATGDKLLRDTVDSWLGPFKDDPLNNYDRYASREEAEYSFDDPLLS